MSFALITLIVSVAVAVACGDGADPARDVADTTTTTSTNSTTTTEPAGPPGRSARGRAGQHAPRQHRPHHAGDDGQRPAESLWCSATRSMFSIRRRRLRNEVTDAIGLLTDAGRFRALLFEIDFVVSDLPVDIPRRGAERCRIRRGDVIITEVCT